MYTILLMLIIAIAISLWAIDRMLKERLAEINKKLEEIKEEIKKK